MFQLPSVHIRRARVLQLLNLRHALGSQLLVLMDQPQTQTTSRDDDEQAKSRTNPRPGAVERGVGLGKDVRACRSVSQSFGAAG